MGCRPIAGHLFLSTQDTSTGELKSVAKRHFKPTFLILKKMQLDLRDLDLVCVSVSPRSRHPLNA